MEWTPAPLVDKVPGLPSDGSQTASNHTCSVSPPTTAADRGYIPMIHLSMEGQEITTLIDSGSHISVITEACHQSIPALHTRALNKTFILASGVMGHPLDMLGTVAVVFCAAGLPHRHDFCVIRSASCPYRRFPLVEQISIRSHQDQNALNSLDAKTQQVEVDDIYHYAPPPLRVQNFPPLPTPREAMLHQLKSIQRGGLPKFQSKSQPTLQRYQ